MYEELAPHRSLSGVVCCEWERGGDAEEILVLPDGCVDVVWRSDGQLFVAGPDLGPVVHPHPPGASFVGLRLEPGAAASVLGVSVDELCDQQVSLEHLWGRSADQLAQRLFDGASNQVRRDVLAEAVQQRLADADLDDAVLAAARTLAVGGERVPDVAHRVGLSDRQFHRRFVRQVGYGPKRFERVMRFRRFVTLSDQADVARLGLAALAAAAGYADQAHLARECRELTARTPSELVAAS
jgi:AraC-like DNA-binding protein